MSQNDNNWQQQAWSQQPAQKGNNQETVPSDPFIYGGVAQQPYPNYVQPTQQPKKRGWIVAIVVVVAIFALMATSLWSCTSMVSSVSSLGSLGASSLDETEFLTSDTVAVISITGTIQYDGTTASPEGFKEQLDKAADSPYIKAVVLRIDSGGGTATAGEEMSAYLKEFVEETGKPVVVSSASINASAAYEISSQATYIYTAKTTAIGSIGTVMQITDLSELFDKLGINIENITSADSKDSSYGTRALSDEERAYYQSMVDQINETFIEAVAEGRDMSVEEVRALATGLTFTGIEAVENGLADEIGTKEDAIDKAAELAGLDGYQTITLETAVNDLYSLFGLATEDQAISVDELAAILKEFEGDGIIAN